MLKLDDDSIARLLPDVPGWSHDGKTIARRYDFKSFLDAVEFVNRVAQKAEAMNHHPFMAIDYRHVTLRLTTWHAGGLTKLDFDQARAFDQLYTARGPAGRDGA